MRRRATPATPTASTSDAANAVDVVSGLLRREITTTETTSLPLEEQIDYDEYRDVDGVQLPFVVRISDGAPYSTVTRSIVEIRRNVPVADSVFRPPTPR